MNLTEYKETDNPSNSNSQKTDPSPASSSSTDLALMEVALNEAKKAQNKGEVPIGAIITRPFEDCSPKDQEIKSPSNEPFQIVGRGHNLRESGGDPTLHAEIIAIREAAEAFGSWRLINTTIYVTLEPCLMCMGALLQARIGRLVYGARDPKAGACGSLYDLSNDKRLNHTIEVSAGILAEESSKLLRSFFSNLRERKKETSTR